MTEPLFQQLNISSTKITDWLNQHQNGDNLKIVKVTDGYADNFLLSLYSPKLGQVFVCGLSPKEVSNHPDYKLDKTWE